MVNIAKTKKRVYYKDVVVVEQAVNGTYSFTPEKDVLCEITLVGAGAGGAFNSSSNRSSAAAGGSASGCIILAVLKAGQTYNAVVGKGGIVNGGLDATATGGRGGNSYIEVVNGAILATAEGGIGGNVWWPNGSSQGTPAPLPTVNTADANIEFQKWLFSKQGIPGAIGGNPSAGGPSVLDGTTYGQGGQAWKAGGSSRGEVGKDGYIKVVYKEPTKGPENLDVLTYSGRNVYMTAGESINIPYGKNGNVNKFLTVTTQESSAFLNSDDDDFYLWIDASGKLFLRATKYFYFQEEEPAEARSLKYWYKPSEHIWRLTEDNGATWQIYEMGIIGRAWQDYSTGDVSDVHYEPYGEWDDYEDTIKSYVAKRKKISIPQGTFKPNYTVVGSPTVNNGVVSGFSTSNYLKLPTVFNPSSVPWEVVFKVNVTDYSNGGIIFGQRNGSYFYIRTEATGVFVTGHSNTILNGTTQIVLGKDYWVKARHDGIKLYLELSEDGINYNEENSVAISSTFSPSSDPQYVGLWYNTYASGVYNNFQGSIDLKESYIKIGSEIWWNCKYNEDVYDTISYVAKRKIRRYYKYEYEDWEQPNFTGYTTGGAVVSATSEDTGDGRFAWKALQTSTQPAANTSDNYGKNNTSTAVWKVKFPYLLKISKIEHQARNWNNSEDYNTVGAYYADEDKTKKIGDVNSPSSGAWTAFNVDYLTDTILLDMTGGGSWSGIGRLKITAQKATPVEVQASDDYDYYVDTYL